MEQNILLSIIANDKGLREFLAYFWLKSEAADMKDKTEGIHMHLMWQELAGFFKNKQDLQRGFKLLEEVGALKLNNVTLQPRINRSADRLIFDTRFSAYTSSGNDLAKPDCDKYEPLDSFLFEFSNRKLKKTIEEIKAKIIEGDFWEVKVPVTANKGEKITEKTNKSKFPFKLPAGTTWENIILKFENEEEVIINVKQFEYKANYREMGFIGRGKDPAPSEAWNFLKVLAVMNGELSIEDRSAKTRYKKQKETLSKKLKAYFGIDLDPFLPYQVYLPYKDRESYKIRMTLIPVLEK